MAWLSILLVIDFDDSFNEISIKMLSYVSASCIIAIMSALFEDVTLAFCSLF